MTLREELLSILEAWFGDTAGVYVHAGVDADGLLRWVTLQHP